MSFPRYPCYKDSGVEWLGQVPENWHVGPIKRLIQKVESGTSVNASDEPAEGGKLGVLKTSCVYTGTFDPDENKTVVEEDIGRVSCPLKAGTLIVSRMNTPELIGAAGLVTQTRDNLYLPDRLWQVSFSNADPRFVHYWTLTSLYRGQVKAVCTGTSSSMKNLGQDQFGAFSFAAPSLAEQTAIAAFLDRETGKIDELVAEQRRLMELLKEKRQAVISHAVTRGLNPAAPLKPSGIDWLGDVPAHWKVSKMKWVARMESGHTPDKKVPAYWENGDIPWVSLNDTGFLKDNDYITETAHSITEAGIANSSAHLLPPRAVVFSRDATIGRCAITTRPMAVSQHFIAWVCGETMIPEFLLMRLRSMTRELDRLTTGATVKTIGMPEVRTLVTPVPPVEEQKEIIAWVSSEVERIDILTAEAQRAIDLLKERRTALISAAVTGQIDVRGIGA